MSIEVEDRAMLTVQVHQVKPNREDLFHDTPVGDRIISRTDSRYPLLKMLAALRTPRV